MPEPSSPQVTAGRDSQWTVETLRIYFDALLTADRALHAERDRRYAEVALARAEALRIKEEANRDALALARDIQTYKDNAHNGLIQQLNQERNTYARADEMRIMEKSMLALIKPLADYITAQQGARRGFDQGRAILASIGGVIIVIIAVTGVIVSTRGGR